MTEPAKSSPMQPAQGVKGAATEPMDISSNSQQSFRIERTFTKSGVEPTDEVSWDFREASIKDSSGKDIFRKDSIEVPSFWSKMASDVVSSRYLHVNDDKIAGDSNSVRTMINRVVSAIHQWGLDQRIFLDSDEADTFKAELTHILLHQKASFNSPVWFNVGVSEEPQVSACFINSVEDSLDGILNLAHTEGMLFKYGSGAGSNFSSIRSSKESLSGGGTASGPVSFLKGLDSLAGAIKSGGKTRRAAKMAILDITHPDIQDFITCKQLEEQKARDLIKAGYDPGFNVAGGAYDSVAFQNTNHSIRVMDNYMEAVLADGKWGLNSVLEGKELEQIDAKKLFRLLATAAHDCGDPGIQFHDTINKWHTCPGDGPIRASNPCSEFMFIDNSACNLASLNLMRFRDENGIINTDELRHAVRVLIMAQEILVDAASYPTEEITHNSQVYRPLGLGYANLGALLMAGGLPYDSDEGRQLAATITAFVTGEAYGASSELARRLGPFDAFERNREHVLEVLHSHYSHAEGLTAPGHLAENLVVAAKQTWINTIEQVSRYGVRHAQTTLLAPTGTIAFMMDCDTTGIEPEMALVKTKRLVGGGNLRMVNNTVEEALKKLGYTSTQGTEIIEYIGKQGTIEGAPHLNKEHFPVFDCAFKATPDGRHIEPHGHIKMMAAVQPFLSGAISKTVNVPNDTTVEEIESIYIDAWELGLKSITIYRDGCKATQPLSAGNDKQKEAKEPKIVEIIKEVRKPLRRPLPDERHSVTHRFAIQGHKGYLTVGLYPDGTPGELFITMAKQGSTVSGLTDAFATAVSMALQYGVPLKVLVNRYSHTRFEPSGFTGNPEIPMAKSVTDYIFRWMALRFLPSDDSVAQRELPLLAEAEKYNDGPRVPRLPGDPKPGSALRALPDSEAGSTHGPGADNVNMSPYFNNPGAIPVLLQEDAPSCSDCGSILVRNGACYRCLNCGASSGCG